MDRIFAWNPRIGNTGDDNWDLNHGTKMDGTVVVDRSKALLGFSSSAYPTTPQIIDVDAGLGANQIVAALNYKSRFIDVSGSPLGDIGYFPVNSIKRVAQQVWTNVAARIAQLRTIEGFVAFDFTAIAAGELPRAWMLAERRKAIALIGVSRFVYGASEGYYDPGQPFLLGLYFSGPGLNPTGFGANIGQFASGFATPTRFETARHFRRLPWMNNWIAASIEVVVSNASGAFTGELWLSNTSDKYYGSPAIKTDGRDNLIGTFSANGTYTFDLAAFASIVGNPSVGVEYLSFILTTQELRTSDPTPGGYNADLTLIRDYGA